MWDLTEPTHLLSPCNAPVRMDANHLRSKRLGRQETARGWLESQPRTRIETETPGYLHAKSLSLIFGFPDSVGVRGRFFFLQRTILHSCLFNVCINSELSGTRAAVASAHQKRSHVGWRAPRLTDESAKRSADHEIIFS